MSGGFKNKGPQGGGLSAAEILWVQTGEGGILLLAETTAPSFTSGVGKVYVKSSDSKLYFMDDSGNEYDLIATGTIGGSTGVTDNAVIRADGVGGATVQSSGVSIDDTDAMSGVASITIDASGSLYFGAVRILADAAGSTTLENIDALDPTTEVTIEAAIDTLANLTSAAALATVGTITTGVWNGTDIAVADGGTGASTAADARTNLGLVAGGTGDIWVAKAGDTMTGALGIGTTPTYKLDVAGTVAEDAIRSQIGFDINPVTNSVAPTIALIASPGNVDAGVHYYFTTFTTAMGETQPKTSSPTSVTTDASNGQVTVGLPISTDPRVTGRKIYRSKAGEAFYLVRLLATISDNTTATYIDNIADTGLSSVNSYWRENTTTKYVTINGVSALMVGDGLESSTLLGKNAGLTIANGTAEGGASVFVGANAGKSITTGLKNNGVGYAAIQSITAGGSNNAFGWGAGSKQTTGSNNTLLGHNAGFYNQTGSNNALVGFYAGFGVSGNSHNRNTMIGAYAGYGITTGNNNILLGYLAGNALTTGSNNIVIGYDIDAPLATGNYQLSLGNLIFGTGINGTGTTLSTGNIGIGTSTPASILSVTRGGSATTTVDWGERGDTSSKVCHNTKNDLGADVSFYFHNLALVVENNRCR